ncbi:MAG: Spy/CpxP family protein refolding chaperone [candidate division KSB1 bacterium]|nr:Spy/CpxP family protein refolding chaperone [candidate division KSB1 bacterium]MDZ7364402.1 Spy/CpxP family protein refolding chaperone [candidate division KSB1 bacterium]MDZ7402774.1 Spy/CpxP family protein refolding chaperone [candidate division KSB1 bacterium]
MKRYALSFFASAAAIVLMAGLTMAQPGGMMQRAEGERMRKPMWEQLGLTSEQKEQIRQVMLNTRKKNIDVEAKQKLARIELHELMSADAPDQNKINAKISELSKTHETLMRNRIESILAVQKVLTPEQRQKAKELRPQMRERRGVFDGFRGRPGMMRHRGFGSGPGFDMPLDAPELDEEL